MSVRVASSRPFHNRLALLLSIGVAGFGGVALAAPASQARHDQAAKGRVGFMVNAANSLAVMHVQWMHLLDAESGWVAATDDLLRAATSRGRLRPAHSRVAIVP